MGEHILSSLQTSEQLKHKHAEAQRRYREKSVPSSVTFLSGTQSPAEILKRPVKRRANVCNSYDPELPALRNLWQRLLRNVMLTTPTIVNRKPSPPLQSTVSYKIIHLPSSLRKRKFVAKFGEDAFFDFYLPQHKLRGADFLPGLAREYAQYLEKHDWPVEKGGMKGAQQDGKQVEKGGKKAKCNKEARISPKM
ncbi:hypothetical protein B0H14DRAFT_2627510 [Mycena olivaceomarginata]|nr:hypothetical protein B0H14DRAFT_2627510 [Mycena olivaceomarginata]